MRFFFLQIKWHSKKRQVNISSFTENRCAREKSIILYGHLWYSSIFYID